MIVLIKLKSSITTLHLYFTPITTEIPLSMNEQLTPDIHPIQIDTNGVIELLKSLELTRPLGLIKYQHIC